MATTQSRVNSKWFLDRLALRDMTQRQVAKSLKLSPSAVSLLLRGKRRFSMKDAAEFARLLSVPIEDVLTNAGIRTPDVKSEGTLPVKGWIDSQFDVHFRAPHGPKQAPKPTFTHPGADVRVIRYQTANTRLDSMDGALVYFQLAPNSSDGSFLGKICVVELEKGGWKLRIVKRGYRSGAFNLHRIDGTSFEEDVALKSVGPVIWMKF